MIGLFDAGVGGVAVVRAIQEAFPEFDLIYCGDSGRFPYADKSPERISRYTFEGVDFLLQKGAMLIVVACHSAASVAGAQLKGRLKVPLLEPITFAAEMAVKVSRHGRIGILGSRATITAGTYIQKIHAIDSDIKVYTQAAPLLVPLVEEGWLKKPETVRIVKKYIHSLKVRQIDTLILGCTHYSALEKIFGRKMGKNVRLIDPAKALLKGMREWLRQNPESARKLSKNGTCRFFLTDTSEHFKKSAQRFYNSRIRLEQVSF